MPRRLALPCRAGRVDPERKPGVAPNSVAVLYFDNLLERLPLRARKVWYWLWHTGYWLWHTGLDPIRADPRFQLLNEESPPGAPQ